MSTSAVSTLRAHSDLVNGCSFSGDGSLLCSASNDQTVCVWDTASASLRRTLRGHDSRVWAARFAPAAAGATRLLSVADDGVALVWALGDGDERVVQRIHDHKERVWSCAFDRGARRFATCGTDDSALVFDWESCRQIAALTQHDDAVTACEFIDTDANLLVTTSCDCKVRVWDVRTCSAVHTLLGHRGAVIGLSLRRLSSAADDVQFATASSDGTIRLWDAQRFASIRTISGPPGIELWSVAFVPETPLLAVASNDPVVRLYDSTNGGLVKTLSGHSAAVTSVSSAIGPRGPGTDERVPLVATSSIDASVCIWQPSGHVSSPRGSSSPRAAQAASAVAAAAARIMNRSSGAQPVQESAQLQSATVAAPAATGVTSPSGRMVDDAAAAAELWDDFGLPSGTVPEPVSAPAPGSSEGGAAVAHDGAAEASASVADGSAVRFRATHWVDVKHDMVYAQPDGDPAHVGTSGHSSSVADDVAASPVSGSHERRTGHVDAADEAVAAVTDRMRTSDPTSPRAIAFAGDDDRGHQHAEQADYVQSHDAGAGTGGALVDVDQSSIGRPNSTSSLSVSSVEDAAPADRTGPLASSSVDHSTANVSADVAAAVFAAALAANAAQNAEFPAESSPPKKHTWSSNDLGVPVRRTPPSSATTASGGARVSVNGVQLPKPGAVRTPRSPGARGARVVASDGAGSLAGGRRGNDGNDNDDDDADDLLPAATPSSAGSSSRTPKAATRFPSVGLDAAAAAQPSPRNARQTTQDVPLAGRSPGTPRERGRSGAGTVGAAVAAQLGVHGSVELPGSRGGAKSVSPTRSASSSRNASVVDASSMSANEALFRLAAQRDQLRAQSAMAEVSPQHELQLSTLAKKMDPGMRFHQLGQVATNASTSEDYSRLLYEESKLRKQELAKWTEEMREYRAQLEMEGVTFKPQLMTKPNKSQATSSESVFARLAREGQRKAAVMQQVNLRFYSPPRTFRSPSPLATASAPSMRNSGSGSNGGGGGVLPFSAFERANGAGDRAARRQSDPGRTSRASGSAVAAPGSGVPRLQLAVPAQSAQGPQSARGRPSSSLGVGADSRAPLSARGARSTPRPASSLANSRLAVLATPRKTPSPAPEDREPPKDVISGGKVASMDRMSRLAVPRATYLLARLKEIEEKKYAETIGKVKGDAKRGDARAHSSTRTPREQVTPRLSGSWARQRPISRNGLEYDDETGERAASPVVGDGQARSRSRASASSGGASRRPGSASPRTLRRSADEPAQPVQPQQQQRRGAQQQQQRQAQQAQPSARSQRAAEPTEAQIAALAAAGGVSPRTARARWAAGQRPATMQPVRVGTASASLSLVADIVMAPPATAASKPSGSKARAAASTAPAASSSSDPQVPWHMAPPSQRAGKGAAVGVVLPVGGSGKPPSPTFDDLPGTWHTIHPSEAHSPTTSTGRPLQQPGDSSASAGGAAPADTPDRAAVVSPTPSVDAGSSAQFFSVKQQQTFYATPAAAAAPAQAQTGTPTQAQAQAQAQPASAASSSAPARGDSGSARSGHDAPRQQSPKPPRPPKSPVAQMSFGAAMP